MKISVELTLSPLQNDYEPTIIKFIQSMRASGLKVLENPLSTQIYGDYDLIFSLLQKEIKNTFTQVDMALFHLKIVKTDRLDYERNY